MARSKYTKDEKLVILNLYYDGQYSLNELASMFNLFSQTIVDWKDKYEMNGEVALEEATSWKPYTKDFKLAAIKDYLSGQYSLREVTKKYSISSTSVLRRWLKKYNTHRDLKDTGKGNTNSMNKGRKTTLQERIQIVEYCLQHEKHFQLTAETFDVSYQQVYQWVRKYEANGEEALRDQRGRKKPESKLTAEEKYNLEMKRLERENERLRAENAFLKKLEEIERRRR